MMHLPNRSMYSEADGLTHTSSYYTLGPSNFFHTYSETQLDWWIARAYRKKREFALELVPEKSFDYEVYNLSLDFLQNNEFRKRIHSELILFGILLIIGYHF